MSKGGHNPGSFIHKVAEAVIDHLILEDGVCTHDAPALAVMLSPKVSGGRVSQQTIYVVRQHLETCPSAGNYRLPYRMKGPMVLVDPDKNLTTLKDLRSERTQVVASAFKSMYRQLAGMTARNIDGISVLATEARNSGDNDLADNLEQVVVDLRATGTIHPSTSKLLAALGVTLELV